MQTINKDVVFRFMEEIWNQQHFGQMDVLVHPQFKDHALPKALPTGKEGLEQWITALGASFEHKTIIEDHVSEGDKTGVRISLLLKHTGTWRDIPPTGAEVIAKGFRFFRVKDGKIIEHWGLIDGQAIESQLKKAAQGCAVAVQKKAQV